MASLKAARLYFLEISLLPLSAHSFAAENTISNRTGDSGCRSQYERKVVTENNVALGIMSKRASKRSFDFADECGDASRKNAPMSANNALHYGYVTMLSLFSGLLSLEWARPARLREQSFIARLSGFIVVESGVIDTTYDLILLTSGRTVDHPFAQAQYKIRKSDYRYETTLARYEAKCVGIRRRQIRRG